MDLTQETEIAFLRSIVRELKAENTKLRMQLGQIFDIRTEREDESFDECPKRSGAM